MMSLAGNMTCLADNSYRVVQNDLVGTLRQVDSISVLKVGIFPAKKRRLPSDDTVSGIPGLTDNL